MTIQQHASFDSSAAELNATSKLVKAWESKNAKNAAKAGGISMMALSLAACGGSSTTTTTATDTTTTTDTATDTTTIVASQNGVFSKDVIDVLVGGAGDDLFTGDNATVTGADSATGGAGSDTVKLVGTTTLPEMSGVETLQLKSFTAADVNVSTTSLADIETLHLDTFTAAAMTVTLGAGQAVDLSDVTGANATISVAGDLWTSGTFNLAASGSATHAIDLDFTSAKTTAVTIKESGTATASFVKVINTGAKAATVNIDSSYKLTVEDVAVATTINAGTSTGAVTLSTAVDKIVYTGSAGADALTLAHADGGTDANEFTVNTGAGNDTITITNLNSATADLLDSKNTINAGEGEDTLVAVATFHATAGGATSAAYAKEGISGFEKIQFSDAHDDGITYNMTNYGANHVIVTTDDANDAIISGLTSGATIEFAKTANDIGGGAGNAADLAFTLTDRAGADDTLNIVIKNTAGAGTFSLDAQEVETISVDASSSDQTNAVELDIPHATTLILDTGTTDLTVDLSAGNQVATLVSLVDATAADSTGGIVFTADGSNLAGITYKGSAGGDNFTGGALSDVVTVGAGDDVIDMAAGTANTLDLSGGGKDTVELNVSAGKTTVSSFTTGDLVNIADTAGDDAEVVISASRSAKYDTSDHNTVIIGMNASTTSIIDTGTQTVADFTDITDVTAYLSEGITTASGEDGYFVLNDGTSSYVYAFVEGGGDTDLDASDSLVLTTVVENHILVAADVTLG
jgi:hypothetical protein